MAGKQKVIINAEDFIISTTPWRPIEVGIYIRLLAHQSLFGSLPESCEELSAIAKCKELDFMAAWPVLWNRFEFDLTI